MVLQTWIPYTNVIVPATVDQVACWVMEWEERGGKPPQYPRVTGR